MLLVFPLSIYAVLGFDRLRWFDKRQFKKLATVLMVFMVVGVGYSTGVFSYVGRVPNSYVAVSLMRSSIDWDQIDDVRAVLRWLDMNAAFSSSVLAEERFYGWTMLYLERAGHDLTVFPYGALDSPAAALKLARQQTYGKIYLIWFSGQVVGDFSVVHSWHGIAVFACE